MKQTIVSCILAAILTASAFAADVKAPANSKPLSAEQTLAILQAQDMLTKAQSALDTAARKTPEFAQYTAAQKTFEEAVHQAESACGGKVNRVPDSQWKLVCTPAPPTAKETAPAKK